MTAGDAAAPEARVTGPGPGLGECLRLAAGSYGLVGRRAGAFLLLAGPWLFIGIVGPTVLGSIDIASGPEALLCLVLWVIAGSAVAIGWHRIDLLGESPFVALWPRLAVFDFAAFSGLALVVAGAAAFLVLRPLGSLMLVGTMLAACLVLFLFLCILSRRLLVFPALAVGAPLASFWRSVGRQPIPEREHWAILGGTLVAAVPAFAIWGLLLIALVRSSAPGVAAGLLETLVTAGFAVTMPALIAGYSSALYRRIDPGGASVRDFAMQAQRVALAATGAAECVRLAAGSYRLFARHLVSFVLLAAPWVAVDVAAKQYLYLIGFGSTQLSTLFIMIGGSAVAIGWHRVLLLGERPLAALRPRKAILEFVGLLLVAWVLSTTVLGLALAALDALQPVLQYGLATAMAVAFALIFLFFISRWLPAFPALAVGDARIRFRQSLRWPAMPEGQRWRILPGTLVAALPVLLVEIFAIRGSDNELARLVLMAVDATLIYAMAALVAGYSSALYRRIVEGP
jgi:hypothetical protein